MAKCFEAYDAIGPISAHPSWHRRNAANPPTDWECLKVAVVSRGAYRIRCFLLYVAKDVVVYLKGHIESGKRNKALVEGVEKPTWPKGWVAGVREIEATRPEEEDGKEWEEGVSVFDGFDEAL